MHRLCDEVVQLIFYELNDPSPLTLVNKRLYNFSQDPYVRAHYFLTRYGPIQAMFHALGRGKILTERVLDILLTSGAHLSRYLIQIAIHHFFRTQAHFIKTAWVRNVPFPVFTYFLKLAAAKYGDIPCGKNDDDGSIFAAFLKESRFPPAMKNVTWEVIRDILEKYSFIPFSNKDPIMAQFPLALAIEPRLLPLAVANGFHMDSKYRDFVFRKMFERPAAASDTRTEDIIHNVRELCRLDPTMFLSRTVAAEICMEAKANDAAYAALKQLNKSGELLFELSTLIEDLIKLFLKTRSLTALYTIQILRQLYTDFPSSDPTVRLVLLLTVFLQDNCSAHTTPASLKAKFDALKLVPTRKDLYNVLVNPFVERFTPIFEWARSDLGLGISPGEIRELVEEVAGRCLEIGCKGKMLKKLHDRYDYLHDTISRIVVERYNIELDDLPPWEDEKACKAYEGKLCRDFSNQNMIERDVDGYAGRGEDGLEVASEGGVEREEGQDGVENEGGQEDEEGMKDMRGEEGEDMEVVDESEDGGPELGRITQETLTTMIRQDELAPTRSRRRLYYPYTMYVESSGKLQYPPDSLPVGRWVKVQFGARSRITAVFMTHAVINDNATMFNHFLPFGEHHHGTATHVPVTLKHFQLLARLGRAPGMALYHDIELGAEFYYTEEDYLSKAEAKKGLKVKVKTEVTQGSIPSPSSSAVRGKSDASPRGKKRPRREAAATVRSYAVPDSDDEAIADDDDAETEFAIMSGQARKKKVESNLQKWIKHLTVLLKEEQRKLKEKKKRLEKAAEPDTKVRVAKSEFFKSLSSSLRNLRKADQEKRLKLYGPELADDDYSDGDDDEYQSYKSARAKRRKMARVIGT